MGRFFTSLGRFTVRFRFLVVLAWIVVTILAVRLLPSLGDVAKDTTSGFLPANYPEHAGGRDGGAVPGRVPRRRDAGRRARRRADGRGQRGARQARARIARPRQGEGRSSTSASRRTDRHARRCSRRQSSRSAAVPRRQSVVDAIRATFADPACPAGLEVHLTGQLATQVDTIAASGSSQYQTQLLSLLFIVVLLLLAFRALLAPLVTLLPAAFVLILAGPVIAESTKLGVQVSSITAAAADRAHPRRRHRLRRVPRVPRARGAPARPDAARSGRPVGEPGRRVDHASPPSRSSRRC